MDAGCHTCLTLFLPDAEGSQGKRPNTHQSQPLSNILLAPAVTSNIHLVAPDAGKNAYTHRNGVAKPTDLQWVQVDLKRKGGVTTNKIGDDPRESVKNKNVLFHLLGEAVIVIRLKDIEFSSFPKCR